MTIGWIVVEAPLLHESGGKARFLPRLHRLASVLGDVRCTHEHALLVRKVNRQRQMGEGIGDGCVLCAVVLVTPRIH